MWPQKYRELRFAAQSRRLAASCIAPHVRSPHGWAASVVRACGTKASKQDSSFRFSDLKIVRKSGDPTPLPPLETLKFGQSYSDHMLVCDWSSSGGWSSPLITPTEGMSIHPGNSALQYAVSSFDGVKAFCLRNGKAAIFRIDENCARLRRSTVRIGLPDFDARELMECVKTLVKVDKAHIPNKEGFSLYIRPTVFSLQPTLGVTCAERARLVCVMCPVGPYFPTGFKPVQLLADTTNVRAWEGGMGAFKVGSNYGPTVVPAKAAAAKGYGQILWLYPDRKSDDHQVTEAGTMNIMILWKTLEGKVELVTPPLSDLILPGITRMSALELARGMTLPQSLQQSARVGSSFEVREKVILMSELAKAMKEKRVLEIFGTGTAAIICPIDKIGFKGQDYEVPLNEENKGDGIGAFSKALLNKLQDIQYGVVDHPWAIPAE